MRFRGFYSTRRKLGTWSAACIPSFRGVIRVPVKSFVKSRSFFVPPEHRARLFSWKQSVLVDESVGVGRWKLKGPTRPCRCCSQDIFAQIDGPRFQVNVDRGEVAFLPFSSLASSYSYTEGRSRFGWHQQEILELPCIIEREYPVRAGLHGLKGTFSDRRNGRREVARSEVELKVGRVDIYEYMYIRE